MATQPTSVTVEFDEPIELGKDGNTRKIESVEIVKPSVGALRGTKLADLCAADTDTMLAVLPRITNPSLAAPMLQKMNPADFVECCNQVVGFLQQRGRPTDSPAE